LQRDLSPDLNNGVTQAILRTSGKTPSTKHSFTYFAKQGIITSLQFFNTRTGMSYGSVALCVSKLFVKFLILSSQTGWRKSDSHWLMPDIHWSNLKFDKGNI